MASEIQVNRALRAPQEFINPENARHFNSLADHDPFHALRVVRPTESLSGEAVGWMQFPSSLVDKPGQGSWADSNTAMPKFLLREIKALNEEAFPGAKFWGWVRILA